MKEEPKHCEDQLWLIVENIVHQRAMAIVANNRTSLSASLSIQHDEESLVLPVGLMLLESLKQQMYIPQRSSEEMETLTFME